MRGRATHCDMEEQGDIVRRQQIVATVSGMIHTASLVYDDILDHTETRRGKESQCEHCMVGTLPWLLRPGCCLSLGTRRLWSSLARSTSTWRRGSSCSCRTKRTKV